MTWVSLRSGRASRGTRFIDHQPATAAAATRAKTTSRFLTEKSMTRLIMIGGRPPVGRVADAFGDGLEAALGIEEEDPGRAIFSPSERPEPISTRPPSVQPVWTSRGSKTPSLRSTNIVARRPVRRTASEGTVNADSRVRGSSTSANISGRRAKSVLDVSRRTLRVRVAASNIGQDPAGDGPEGSAVGRKPHFGLDAGLEIGRLVLEEVGQDPDTAQVGHAEKLVPAGEPLARRNVPVRMKPVTGETTRTS